MTAPELRRPKAIIFDWDNTLVDSWLCIRTAMNATLAHMGHAEWSMEETKARVARSLRDAFPDLFGDRWTEARDHFYAKFNAIHIELLQPLPGTPEMLAGLAEQGIRLSVVSNKTGRFLRAEAAHLGWDRLFDRLVGATDAHADKPECAPVLMALEPSGLAPGPDVWLVGDAPIDMECARKAGCVPILMREHPPLSGEFDRHPPVKHLLDRESLTGLVNSLF